MARTILAALLMAGLASAQSSPQSVAEAALQRWAAEKTQRSKGLATAVRTSGDRALLLISGNDTDGDMSFSGPYEARRADGQWALGRRIPLEELGKIVAQELRVDLRPGTGVDVVDRMTVRVGGGDGFAAHLNPRTQIRGVEAGGRAIPYQFGGGLLWIDAPRGAAEVTLAYTLPVERGPDNSASFQEAFGHIRNQYYWHPFFDFASASDRADFRIELRLPKEYHATTSLPQTERVDGDTRVIEGRTVQPTKALTLAYDREWRPASEQVGKIRLELFLAPEFRPDAAALIQEFRTVHAMLSSRFGELASEHFAIVQLRGDPGNRWHFNSNQAVFAAGSPGLISRPQAAPLAHEIAHWWTDGTGPAANFLREGWATYVESLVLESKYGTPAARNYWRSLAQTYFLVFDGRTSILEDPRNSGASYAKGPWVFRMLEQAVGQEAFSRAMTQYSRRSLSGGADWETLAECFAGFDARQFLLPWLKETTAPKITGRVQGQIVTLHQDGPFFPLRIDVEGTTAQGLERRTVVLHGGDASAEFSGEVTGVRLDPDELLLIQH